MFSNGWAQGLASHRQIVGRTAPPRLEMGEERRLPRERDRDRASCEEEGEGLLSGPFFLFLVNPRLGSVVCPDSPQQKGCVPGTRRRRVFFRPAPSRCSAPSKSSAAGNSGCVASPPSVFVVYGDNELTNERNGPKMQRSSNELKRTEGIPENGDHRPPSFFFFVASSNQNDPFTN